MTKDHHLKYFRVGITVTQCQHSRAETHPSGNQMKWDFRETIGHGSPGLMIFTSPIIVLRSILYVIDVRKLEAVTGWFLGNSKKKKMRSNEDFTQAFNRMIFVLCVARGCYPIRNKNMCNRRLKYWYCHPVKNLMRPSSSLLSVIFTETPVACGCSTEIRTTWCWLCIYTQ